MLLRHDKNKKLSNEFINQKIVQSIEINRLQIYMIIWTIITCITESDA